MPALKPHGSSCPILISDQTITPLNNTKHLLVSAYMDQRKKEFDIRIIGIFKRDSIQPLHCLFCCVSSLSETTPATVLPHSDHFGFPFGATDVVCRIPPKCDDATHVTLVTEAKVEERLDHIWLPIRNRKEERRFNFTVCISSLFGNYSNVLQYAQTLEMYRLLGVDRVVIYNTSCSADLDRLLQSYSKEGFVEIVPWPIDKHLKPSRGWKFSEHGGDLHYFGQLVKLNECIYRSMERSRYVLLNDIDEIIMPYQHNNLTSLMRNLEKSHKNVGVFLIENHIFPTEHIEPSHRFHLRQWARVPTVNILRHIHREEPDRNLYQRKKMIVQPRSVVQTSVHEVLEKFGEQHHVPSEVCRLIHIREGSHKSLRQLHEDRRLWDFQEKLIPNVDMVLKRAGLLAPDGYSRWTDRTNKRACWEAKAERECAPSDPLLT
ncbi:uncharacterized protein LOC133462127 [Cololabis saira]|uniref:uncharacterized protein LOC133462127 n=1 Tax=Cololabis saira TaxID=129043 RepID=UPI002AD44016|nr:uncharacterized protein LOC133462127 [Cololabis saira]